MTRRPLTGAFIAVVVVGLGLAVLGGAISLPVAVRIAVALVGLAVLLIVHGLLPIDEYDPAYEPGGVAAALVDSQSFLGRLFWRKRRGEDQGLPGPLGAIERVIRISEGSSVEFTTLLRPRLVSVASRRLAETGINERDPEALRSALGEVAYLVEPPSGTPGDRHAPGEPATAVLELLERLEAIT